LFGVGQNKLIGDIKPYRKKNADLKTGFLRIFFWRFI